MTLPAKRGEIPLHPTKGYPICGARKRQGDDGGICTQKAGWGTDHPGQGRCKLHGGAAPRKHGRYSTVTNVRVRELLAELEDDPNPLDVIPDIQLVRALVKDWLDRYVELRDALLAWNATLEEGQRPARVPEVQDVRALLESVSRMVARVEKTRSANFMPRQRVLQLMAAMGRVVDAHVTEEVARAIHEEWLRIELP